MEAIKRSSLLSPLLFRAYNHVLRRLSSEYEARAYFGATFRCNLDDMISRTIFYFGFWEPNNSALIGSILKPGDIFVDVGANIGYYSLLAAERVGASGQVVAIEPSPAIFEQLSANASANGTSNIRLLNVAASDVRGELLLYGGTKWNRGATSTIVHDPHQAPEARVPAAPLDELMLPYEMESVALIKIDIEGGELQVLQRILATLDRFSPEMKILVEMSPHVSGDRLRATFDAFLAAGFEAFEIENEYDTDWYLRWRRPSALRRVETCPDRQMDVLLVRAPSRSFLAQWNVARQAAPTGVPVGATADLHANITTSE
jgi:FkbM family methyltransferase